MIAVPSLLVRGESETPVVCRSALATPAAFSAAITAAAAAAFFAIASFAVVARVVTANWNEARSGAAVAAPLPVTVIVRAAVAAPAPLAGPPSGGATGESWLRDACNGGGGEQDAREEE